MAGQGEDTRGGAGDKNNKGDRGIFSYELNPAFTHQLQRYRTPFASGTASVISTFVAVSESPDLMR